MPEERIGAPGAAQVEVAAVGDLMLGDSAICTGFGLASRYAASELELLFEEVKECLVADLTIGNLETPLSSAGLRPARWASAQMRGRPGYAEALRRVGFDVLNVANNHALQHGLGAFRETLELLDAAGIAVCGLRGSGPWSSRPLRWTTRSGVELGILGYCLRPRQYTEEDPPYAEGDDQGILSDVGRLAVEVDHVIVSLHWGEEFVARPSRREVRLARQIVQQGARMVVGHHPHVLRPVELRENALIAYSLGNFAADMVWYEPLRRGAVLRCRLGRGKLIDASLLATRIDDDFRPRRWENVPLPTSGESVEGVEAETYRKEAARTVHIQRRAAYSYALRKILRYPPGLLVQLVVRTLRNRFDAARA